MRQKLVEKHQFELSQNRVYFCVKVFLRRIEEQQIATQSEELRQSVEFVDKTYPIFIIRHLRQQLREKMNRPLRARHVQCRDFFRYDFAKLRQKLKRRISKSDTPKRVRDGVSATSCACEGEVYYI